MYIAQHQEDFMEFGFIKKGYRKWMERATFEKLHVRDQEFLDVLVPELQKLDHLDTVNLCGEWRSYRTFGFPNLGTGSLLRRNWDPFILEPLSWCWRDSYKIDPYRPTGRFWATTTALSRASKRPRIFQCVDTISPSAFEMTTQIGRPERSMLADGCRAYAGRQHFNLGL